MTENIIAFIGSFLKHAIGALVLSWRRMLRAGLVAFAAGVTLALLVAVIVTGQAFPGAMALVAALLFGVALGYSVALTVLVEEIILGIVDLIHLLEGDAKKVAHITEALAEREVGEVGQGLRRLIGLPVSARRRAAATTNQRASKAMPATPPTLPPLPRMPRYPTTPATPAAPSTPTTPATPATPATAAMPSGPAASVRVTATASVVSAAVQAAAAVGAAALATRAAAPAATAQPVAPVAPPEPEAPPPPMGEPVPADRLPRIAWTYEHEAITPAQVAAVASARTPAPAAGAPDTLAELAGASVVADADRAAGDADAEPAAAPEPMPAPVERPPDAALTVEAYSPSAPAVATEDAPPLDDEPLTAPASLDIPEEDYSAPEPERPAAIPVDAPPTAAATVDRPPLDPAMLTPAPATTPLPQDEPTTAAPALVEIAAAEPVAAEAPEPEPVAAEEAPAAETPAAEESEPLVAAEPSAAEESEPVATMETPAAEEPVPEVAEPVAAVEESDPAPLAASAEAEAATVPPPMDDASAVTTPARTVFSRITRPIEDLGAALESISRTGVVSGPRPSVPESGLWERLSQALIDRSGAPSSPFAAPQSAHPSAPGGLGDTTASESDGTPQG